MTANHIDKSLLLLVCILPVACAAQEDAQPLVGRYLGQEPPGLTPVVFAPGVVSTRANELNAAFSPDGNELYFSVSRAGRYTVMTTKFENVRWTDRSVATFSGEYSDVDPFVSADGEKLYYSSKRPMTGSGEAKDSDIWYVERMEGGAWSEPIHLGALNSQGQDDYYTSISSDGTLYFSKFGGQGEGGDLYWSRLSDGAYGEPELLGAPFSTGSSEHDPFIAPDGSYLIFTSNRPGGYGEGDLYVSFRNSDRTWSDPLNMGEGINSAGYDYCAMLSPDGEYLFFTRTVDGNGDIYWVDAAIIGALRSEANGQDGS
jgi:Tol biopolymer transport system component